MESIKEIYCEGYGPSSSHTMGPRKAAEIFKSNNPEAVKYRVTLYGSLAATGKGHLTDKVIKEVFTPNKTEIIWEPAIYLTYHPNGMTFEAIDANGISNGKWTAFSVGGGAIVDEDRMLSHNSIYPLNQMSQIQEFCEGNGLTYWEYVEKVEGEGIWDYLKNIWKVMKEAVERGIENEGILPGTLKLQRKSSSYYTKASDFNDSLKRRSLVYAFALAVSEENAAGGKIVTAPTCGSCGVLPGALYLLYKQNNITEIKILRALATAGLIGNIIKNNASISGAMVGCQGEVGAACAMAAGAATQLMGGTPAQIEYAAEMGLEHHLGLTCDPIAGLVQIPCIERNAFAASRALDCCTYAIMSDGKHRVSFDKVVRTMKQTGHDLPNIYKETSEGGLAVD
jgi:L-serine dehydratase